MTGLAHADKAASIEHYNKGRALYAAASFEAAVAEFDLAYREFPAPEYLHDIGQAYRRLEKCDALGYFERYLAAKSDAKNRTEVEKTIAALRPRCASTTTATPAPTTTAPTTTAPKTTAPTTTATTAPPGRTTTVTSTPSSKPAGGKRANDAAGADRGATRANDAPTAAGRANVAMVTDAGARRTSDDARVTTMAPRSSPFSATASAGVVLLDAGPVVMPPIGQLDLGARYRLTEHPLRVDIGAGFSLARLPFDDTAMGTAWLVTPEIVGEAHFVIRPRLGIVAKLGVGPMFVSGLDAGNPFTEGGMPTSTIAMMRVHVDAGVAWDATDRVRVYAMPGYQRSSRREELASDISALHGLSISAGVSVGW
ncbi:MAG: hypothetical protein ACKV2T_25815 [Kofleriaceae bacterium]